MPHKYVDWFTAKSPRSDSLVNLNKLVIAADQLGAIHPAGRQTGYAIAKKAGVAYSRAANLMDNRPGFVTVMHNGEAVGLYWDRDNFGSKYPEHYVDRTKTRVLSVYDITPEESLGEKAASARQIEAMIEGTVTKELPLIFKAPPVEGVQATEYRIIFNVADGATLEQYLPAIQKFALEVAEGKDVRVNLNNFMRLELALLHAERTTDGISDT